MKVLVTGSTGHLGEGLVRTLRSEHEIVGLDVLASDFTRCRGSITDRAFVRDAMQGVDVVLHTATLHKPHVATHSRQDFIDVNVTGTLNLLEEAVEAKVRAFVFTSTTSVFGLAMNPGPGDPARWITEAVRPIPKNIYGVSKAMAENLCELFHHKFGLPCLVLRTSRFFPEQDDDPARRAKHDDANLKVNEFLHRRVDLHDAVSAHQLAMDKASSIGFGRYIISATTPLRPQDADALRDDVASAVAARFPQYAPIYAERGWSLPDAIGRVYDNTRARQELGWAPEHDFARAVRDVAAGRPFGSELARAVGSKGYHAEQFASGPYPVED